VGLYALDTSQRLDKFVRRRRETSRDYAVLEKWVLVARPGPAKFQAQE
jgi:hypothetical protein